jgi:hypothetical protein
MSRVYEHVAVEIVRLPKTKHTREPRKRLSQKEIHGLPKGPQATYRAVRAYRDRQQALAHAEAFNKYLENALQSEHSEKELSLTVWTDRAERMFKNLRKAREVALKCRKPSLDRCRDEQQFLALRVDLLSKGIGFTDADLHDLDRRAQLIDEWQRKVDPFPKTRVGRELRQSLEVLKQDADIKEVGKLNLKVVSGYPS